jgi:cellulose synthase (UDP-forming)
VADPLTETARGRRNRAVNNRPLVRILVLLTLALGVNYVVWRWLESANWSVWWIAVPLVLAETYSLVDAFLFGLTMWKIKERGEPEPPPADATVDVFVTTYNEPIDLVMTTAVAARDIRFPHRTWVLDDGARDEMRAAAEAAGIGYITRSPEWADMPRHAKAGNLNNALLATEGEFLLILDADQIPEPQILDRTLGYFRDPKVALVQTPQFFTNVTESDPLGSQAPLFYGPIQKGKDGWNAAFFCGSNAVLRRDALMQLGVVSYVREVQRGVRKVLRTADAILANAARSTAEHGPAVTAALGRIREAVVVARAELATGQPVAEATFRFQQSVDAASRDVVTADVAALRADLAELAELPGGGQHASNVPELTDDVVLDRLAAQEMSPLRAIASVRALVDAVDVDRRDEAQPLMPMATISVTEDMATAMRIHVLGWKTVYHHENLANGLAPEDLGTMLQQRLRWAQGTLQVMLRENPLLQRGLSLGQRLMYFATMWSYLSGFAALAYIAAPVLFLLFSVHTVNSFGGDFLIRLIPYLVFNQILFMVIGYGQRTWRGTQYSLALFPLWIRATWTAVGNVVFKRSLGFVVTPKTRVQTGPPWRLIWPQLAAMGVLAVAGVVGLARLLTGVEPDGVAVMVNVIWVVFDLVILSVIVQAARYDGPIVRPEGKH